MSPSPAGTEHRSRWWMLGLLFTVYAFNIVDRHIINILLEPIRLDLDLSDSQAGFLAGFAFAIFYTLMGVPIAALADRYSRTRLITLCSALWSAMTALTGMATGYVSMALTRMGVGIGEAGLTPSANSLIGDLFRPTDRGKAIGIYQSAVPVGTMLAGLIGGFLGPSLGWRMTFILLGAAGMALTLLFWAVFREPARGLLDDASSRPEKNRYSIIETVRHLLRQKSCQYFFPAFALVGLVGSAVNTWTPAYFMRSHEMSLMHMATTIGTIGGIGGAVGMVGGGIIADRLARRDVAAYMQIPAIALLAAIPLFFGVYLAGNAALSAGLLLGPMIVGTAIVVPVLALIQRLVKNNMRAVAVAVFLLVIHLLGMGLGPLAVGMLSDALEPVFGTDSLRYALLSVMPLNLLAVWLFWRARRHVASDLGLASM
ncbi:spinster family MFS transporter [Elongatibacter sediminis]|uniref:MFS transporter n=1 Tax=Elongatibacter sediminis TaxID=3119006 RepID=A0AAW9R6W1_9GAMM